MIIENKEHKRLIEMTDEEIRAIVTASHCNVLEFFNGRWRKNDGPAIYPNCIYRAIPPYTPITVSWSVLVDSIQWIAADKNGNIYGYSNQPEAGEYCWNFNNQAFSLKAIKSLNRGDIPWDQSLIKRPEGEPK